MRNPTSRRRRRAVPSTLLMALALGAGVRLGLAAPVSAPLPARAQAAFANGPADGELARATFSVG